MVKWQKVLCPLMSLLTNSLPGLNAKTEEKLMSDEQSIRVLLIDDEENLVEFMSKRLLRQGFTVKAAFSGEDAINAARQERYDVAVVDLKMPGIDGVETQKTLREIQPFLQCIVLTGHGSIESALESGQQEAFQYLLKPVDYDSLTAAIKDAFERKVKLQGAKFKEEVEEIQRSGMGAHGLRRKINELQEMYGIK
jgi:DNA-binding NtrC family response regulator